MVLVVYYLLSKLEKFENNKWMNLLIQMSSIDQGNNGRIYETPFGVKKMQKRGSEGHDILTQKRIHSYAASLIKDLNLQKLWIPLINEMNTNEYEMQKISTKKIIYPGSPNDGELLLHDDFEKLFHELAILWIYLWKNGFAAWDYELFLQSDGKIALIDFDKFGFHMTSGPRSVTMPLNSRGSGFKTAYFFQNPCFPHDFIERLRSLGFEPPADMLPSSLSTL